MTYTYDDHCASMDRARGVRECVDTRCAHCEQKAEQTCRARKPWRTVRCEVCDEPVCLSCAMKVEDGEIPCGKDEDEATD